MSRSAIDDGHAQLDRATWLRVLLALESDDEQFRREVYRDVLASPAPASWDADLELAEVERLLLSEQSALIDHGRLAMLRHGLQPHGWAVSLDEAGETVSLYPTDPRWRIRFDPELVCAPLREGGRPWWQWVTSIPGDIAGVVRTPITPGNEVGKAVRLIVCTLRKNYLADDHKQRRLSG